MKRARAVDRRGWVCALLATLLLGPTTLSAPPDWENEQVIGRNKEPGRATSLPFPDHETALDGDRGTWSPSSRCFATSG